MSHILGREHRAKTRSHGMIDEIAVQIPVIAFENS